MSYVIDLHGLVRHMPITREVAKRFRTEFAVSLPQHMVLLADPTMLECEIAARNVAGVARYIIGVAAALSGDFELAEQLLLDAEKRLADTASEDDAIGSVTRSQVEARIVDLYNAWSSREFRTYFVRRDPEALRRAEAILAKLEKRGAKGYGYHLRRAICDFVLRRDVVGARQHIAQCRRAKDATWKYSEAFLVAYGGDLEAAYKQYKNAFRAPLADATVPTQSEEFIQIVVDEEPERPWLFFCLGVINMKLKGDMEAARRDLEQFVLKCDQPRFGAQVALARKWLADLGYQGPALLGGAH